MKKQHLVIFSLAGATILSLASLSFSYAWYVASSSAHVQFVNIDLNAEENLLISTSPEVETFKPALDYSDVEQHVGFFKPVSSVYKDTWMSQKQVHPSFFDSSATYSSGTVSTPVYDGYYTQELYVYAEDDVYVSIDSDPDQTFIKPDVTANTAYADEIYDAVIKTNPTIKKEDIVNRLGKLPEAMRFSLLNPDENNYDYAVVDPHKYEETVLAGLLDNNIDQYYDFNKQPGEESYKEILYGEVNDRSLIVYDEPRKAETVIKGESSAFNAKHAANVKLVNLEKSIDNGLVLKKEASYSLSDFNTSNPGFEIPVKRYTPTKFVLSIYIEGWDLDSVNYTMGAAFEAKLSLKITRRM